METDTPVPTIHPDNIPGSPFVPRDTGDTWPPFPQGSPASNVTQPEGHRFHRSKPLKNGDLTADEQTNLQMQMENDLKYMHNKMYDPQAAAELETQAKHSWNIGQKLLKKGREWAMMLARNRDPAMIYQTTYSLGRFDLALYLRLEAGADSIEDTVVDLENGSKYLKKLFYTFEKAGKDLKDLQLRSVIRIFLKSWCLLRE